MKWFKVCIPQQLSRKIGSGIIHKSKLPKRKKSLVMWIVEKKCYLLKY